VSTEGGTNWEREKGNVKKIVQEEGAGKRGIAAMENWKTQAWETKKKNRIGVQRSESTVDGDKGAYYRTKDVLVAGENGERGRGGLSKNYSCVKPQT